MLVDRRRLHVFALGQRHNLSLELLALLLAQLQAVAHHFSAPRLPVLPRNEVALFNGALLRKAAQAFQKQLLPFPAAQAADSITMSCQLLFSLHKTKTETCRRIPSGGS